MQEGILFAKDPLGSGSLSFGVGVGDIEIFISQYIQKKYCGITIYKS